MQFVQTFPGILGPSHFVFLLRQESQALSTFRFLDIMASTWRHVSDEVEGPGTDELGDVVSPRSMTFL